jgi:hypothetical protein
MSPIIPRVRQVCRRYAARVLVLCSAACTQPQEPDSLVGVWRGSNPVFTQFQLNFQAQTAETVWGSAFFIFAQTASTVADTDFAVITLADSLMFTKPVPASTGYQHIEFRGRHQGVTIDGVANGSPIILKRQRFH